MADFIPHALFLLFTELTKNVIISISEGRFCAKLPEIRVFLRIVNIQEKIMNFRINANSFKNAMGTVFLLAAAFFVCSTFISMRSVFADPIAPANTLPQRTGRASPRATANNNASVARSTVARSTVSRATVRPTNAVSRATVARGNASSRTVSQRGTTNRNVNVAKTTTTRGVTSRGQSATRSNRAVRARTATSATPSRVSATGSIMAGSRASTSTSYSYLASSLYTGSYSNIIDSTTGLISADAYSNCMASYYTCMDEICTARSDTKGRCSCAGRATNFLDAEEALEAANEELIKLSGQLSLLIATKGRGNDLASAFSLTDAEKVMNCVSYKENVIGKKMTDAQWYEQHLSFSDNALQTSGMPSYCSDNDFGFDIKNIDGSSSDILAQLKAWADAKDLAKQYETDDGNLITKYTNIANVVNNMNGVSSLSDSDTSSLDSLANKWGYKLFEYAHNNVCGRVLDSCFNGIYEACGTPVNVTDSEGKTHSRCGNGATSECPFNYNSYISVVTSGDNQGDVKLNERNSSSSVKSTASCFGYTTTTTTTTTSRLGTTTTSTDPYASLRGPVADARRSIMQKYLLDANAACDTYGTALKQTAQNINYQKIAAEQALQQKRLEFKQEEEATILADATAAIDNFNECISEIWDCYDEYEDEDKWTTARIKAYCSQVSQVPHCYETMICSPLQTQLVAVVDKADSNSCIYSNDYSENTCRNVVTISEILYGTGQTADDSLDNWNSVGKLSVKSAAVREQCLERALGCAENSTDTETTYCLRTWKKGDTNSTDSGTGTIGNGTSSGTTSCSDDLLTTLNAATGYIQGNDCIITSCIADYSLANNRCVRNNCSSSLLNSLNATAGYANNGSCDITQCKSDYSLVDNQCVRNRCSSAMLDSLNAAAGYANNGACEIVSCKSGYGLSDGLCVKLSTTEETEE